MNTEKGPPYARLYSNCKDSGGGGNGGDEHLDELLSTFS